MELRHRPSRIEPSFSPEVEEIWCLVGRLPERQRHAVVLRFYGDHSFEKIAELLACPSATAKSLVRRALVRLRVELGRRTTTWTSRLA